MTFTIETDAEEEAFILENGWDTIIPVSFETVGEKTAVSCFPAVESEVRQFLEKYGNDLYSDVAMHALFATLAPYMEKWGYEDDRFRDRWGYILRGKTPAFSGDIAKVLTADEEKGNETTYDLVSTLHDGRLACGVVINGKVLSLAVTHTPIMEGVTLTEVGVETVKNARNRGYAKAALSCLMQELEKRGIETEYRCQRYNKKSYRVAVGCGLVPIGRYYFYVGRKKHGI